MTDITDSRQLTQLLKRAANSSSEGITISTVSEPDRPLVYVNDGFVRLTGYSLQESIGRNCRFLQGEKTDPETVDEIRNAIREERSCTVELLNYRKDGSEFWNRLSITPIRNTLNEVTHYVGIQSDISEIKNTRARLERANADLERFRMRIMTELDQARLAQEFLLPAHLPLAPTIRFASKFEPMTEIGGDFYDIIELTPGLYGILIADVTGHGIPAALLTFMSSTAFKNTAPLHRSTYMTISQTNERLVGKMPNDAFVTMFYAIYDSRNHTLNYTQAGHPDAFLLRPDTGEVHRLETGGTLIGVFAEPEAAFSETTIGLRAGDKVVFYTDAISETLQASTGSDKPDPLEQFLQKYMHLPLSELFDKLYDHGLRIAGLSHYEDDFTLVGFEVFE